MVCTPLPGMAKLMASLPGRALASRIACRNEPGPASAMLVTRKVESSVRSSTRSNRGPKRTLRPVVAGRLGRYRRRGRGAESPDDVMELGAVFIAGGRG